MNYSIYAQESNTVRQTFRWAIVLIFFFNFISGLFLLINRPYFYYRMSTPLTFYIALISAITFCAFGFVTQNRNIKIGSWLIAVVNIITLLKLIDEIYFYFMYLFYAPDVLQNLIFLSGVIFICSDKNNKESKSTISLLYIFMLGTLVLSPVYGYLRNTYMNSECGAELLSWTYYIISVACSVVAIIFWYKILKPNDTIVMTDYEMSILTDGIYRRTKESSPLMPILATTAAVVISSVLFIIHIYSLFI